MPDTTLGQRPYTLQHSWYRQLLLWMRIYHAFTSIIVDIMRIAVVHLDDIYWFLWLKQSHQSAVDFESTICYSNTNVVRSHSHSHRFCCILCCCRCSCTLVYKTCNNDSWNLCRLCLPFTVHIGSHNIVWGNTIERIAVSTQAKQHTTKSWLNNLANSIRSSRQRIHTCWPSSFNDGLP